MRNILLSIMTLLLPQKATSQDFDAKVNQDISKFNFTQRKMSYAKFQKSKEISVLKTVNKETQLTEIDEYTLTNYVHETNPIAEALLEKYELLGENSKFIFIQKMIIHNNSYFKTNKELFSKLLEKFTFSNENDRRLLDFTKIYTNSQRKLDDFKLYLSNIQGLSFSEKAFLLDIVNVERESDFAYDLLIFLSGRNDWKEHFIHYWTLFETKNTVLNNKYKKYFKDELLTVGYYDNPWNGFSTFLPKWFTPEEIIEICEIKKNEKQTYHDYFFARVRDVSSIEYYIANAGIYQAKYFPIENTIEIIDALSITQQKLILTLYLVNVRQNLTQNHQVRLKTLLYNIKEEIATPDDTEILIQIMRRLDRNIPLKDILSDFPNLYKDWQSTKHLQKIYNASKHNWLDIIQKSNALNTFGKMLLVPDDYYLAESLAGNYNFDLAADVLEAIFQMNNLNVSLSDEYGYWPVDYSNIIKNSFAIVWDKKLTHSAIDYFYHYDKISEKATKYQINAWHNGNRYTITFIDTTGRPNNQALTFLFNKILIESDCQKRFVKYSPGSNNLTFVEPKRYEKLMKSLK